MGIDDILGGEDFFELAVVGCLSHPLRFGNVTFEAACPSELAPQLESPTRSMLMGLFALAAYARRSAWPEANVKAPSGK